MERESRSAPKPPTSSKTWRGQRRGEVDDAHARIQRMIGTRAQSRAVRRATPEHAAGMQQLPTVGQHLRADRAGLRMILEDA